MSGLPRGIRLCAAALLVFLLATCPAFAQRSKQQAPAAPSEPKPVVEYIVVVVLLAAPLLLVCRSSRRMS